MWQDCEVLVGGDSNGHVGSDMGDFGDVHEDYGIGQIKGLGDQIVGLGSR